MALAQEIGDEAGQAYILTNLGLVARDREHLATAEQLLTTGLALAQAQNDQYLVAIFLNYLSSVNLHLGQKVGLRAGFRGFDAFGQLKIAAHNHPKVHITFQVRAAANIFFGNLEESGQNL